LSSVYPWSYYITSGSIAPTFLCGIAIESQVFRYFGTGAVLRVKNTTEENAEYIYELSRKILEKVQKQHPALTDDFYNLGQIESVNIVAQSDEIYN
jgi:hypothetical protein